MVDCGEGRAAERARQVLLNVAISSPGSCSRISPSPSTSDSRRGRHDGLVVFAVVRRQLREVAAGQQMGDNVGARDGHDGRQGRVGGFVTQSHGQHGGQRIDLASIQTLIGDDLTSEGQNIHLKQKMKRERE